VRRGLGASDTPQVAPVGQSQAPAPSRFVRDAYNAFRRPHRPQRVPALPRRVDVRALHPNRGLSDEFSGTALGPQWSWVRPPSSGFSVSAGSFNFDTQAARPQWAREHCSFVLVEGTPAGNYMVETKGDAQPAGVGLLPELCRGGRRHLWRRRQLRAPFACIDLGDRQTEFAEEVPNPMAGYPNFGSSVGAPPDATTWLRIAKVTLGDGDHCVSYVSRDGATWRRGAVWVDAIGPAQLGLLSMSGAGFTANFDYVHVYELP